MKNKENLREKQVNLRLTQAEYERLTRTAQDTDHITIKNISIIVM